MSKVDAQRAMREGKYAAMQVQAQARPRTARRPATVAVEPEPSVAVEATEAPAEALCGHRGGAGRPCTRPAKHAEKSHRYA